MYFMSLFVHLCSLSRLQNAVSKIGFPNVLFFPFTIAPKSQTLFVFFLSLFFSSRNGSLYFSFRTASDEKEKKKASEKDMRMKSH